jgi:hypothetical protein
LTSFPRIQRSAEMVGMLGLCGNSCIDHLGVLDLLALIFLP